MKGTSLLTEPKGPQQQILTHKQILNFQGKRLQAFMIDPKTHSQPHAPAKIVAPFPAVPYIRFQLLIYAVSVLPPAIIPAPPYPEGPCPPVVILPAVQELF